MPASVGETLPVHTIFFGGGTPSLLPASGMEKIWEPWRITSNGCPRPRSAWRPILAPTAGYLRDLAGLGFNRLSLGMQSARPEELVLLERQHSYSDVIQAVTWAHQIGLDNFNLDLIFGLPEQTLTSWQHAWIWRLTSTPPPSLYALTLEPGTPLFHWAGRGLPEPDPDLAADMYEWASERLEASGYQQYEISNWAAVSPFGELLACRQNLRAGATCLTLGWGPGRMALAVRCVLSTCCRRRLISSVALRVWRSPIRVRPPRSAFRKSTTWPRLPRP